MDSGTLGVAVGVMLLNDEGHMLLGRKMYDGGEIWTMPGGALEYGETLEDAVRREVKEECNLEVDSTEQMFTFEHNNKDKNTQFVTVAYKVGSFSGELKNNESDKFFEWRWFALDKLPENLFEPSRIISNKSGLINSKTTT
jgi:8-oxo-dGTP diphosphatase